jgi:hypothetical protein
MVIGQECVFGGLNFERTNAIDSGDDRILDIVELEAGGHIGDQTDGVSTVNELESVAEAELLHDA